MICGRDAGSYVTHVDIVFQHPHDQRPNTGADIDQIASHLGATRPSAPVRDIRSSSTSSETEGGAVYRRSDGVTAPGLIIRALRVEHKFLG